MVAINQRIPNFLGGVSQQPDTIKFPGQVRVMDNAVPDVTFGLMKRPPGEFVKALTNANSTGYWYEIIRDGDEKYLVQITPGNTGSIPIRIWDLADGTEKSLTNSSGDSLFAYLSGATQPYALQTIQDYTIIANPQKTVGTTGNTSVPLNSGDYAFARLDTIAYNTEYTLYSGSTAPTPNKYFRATALEVHKGTTDGNTWDDSNKDGRYAGLGQFSFSGGNNITVPGGQVAIENLEGHVTVNAASYVDSNQSNYDGGGSSASNFLGYTQVYKTRYTAQVTLKDGGLIKTTTEATALGCYIDLTIEGISYRIKVVSVEPVDTYEGVAGIGWYRSPKNPDKGSLSMSTVIQALHTSINANLANVTSEVIGSGLYLYGSAAPTVNFLGGAVNENMNIIGNTAQDVSRLPAMCKHGYVAQIANSENVDADNYYVEFIADNGTQGSGRWEECVRPHNFSSGSDPMVKGWDPATMPHALVNNRNGTFSFKKLDETTANADNNDNYWKYREVGDDITNPFPSFNGKEIQKIFFHRNRLGLIANEQVVLSRPGDYFNFFVVSAITTSDDNQIDITVSDIKPAFVNHVLQINKGVLIFSDNGQFMLFTESDIFSPKTARLKKISSYECDASIQPIDMGTSAMFTSNVSAYTRAYESTILDDDVPPKILEQTRVVPEYIPKDITMSANSTSLGLVTFGKKGSSEIYHYKYFDAGERRDQSAWYSWTLTGTLQHMCYTGGSFFSITLQGSDYVLNRYEYVADATSARTYVLGGAAADVGSPLKGTRWFEACLDNMTIPTAITYTAQGGSTTGPAFTDLTIPYTPTSASNFYAVALSGNDTNGNSVAGQVVKATSVNTNKATFVGVNMTGWTVAVGYRYTTTVELPNYYLALGENRFDIDGDLRISGINFEMGVGGPMEFHLSSTYADSADYIQYESGLMLDDSDYGKPPSRLTKSIRVPIQRKNEKYNLTIKIPDPFSTALISGSWDGKYNQRRYARK
tara:strand:+ start:780 stop:3740 length:2961 start_codon:yes stop_codon:yes gene_type:complete